MWIKLPKPHDNNLTIMISQLNVLVVWMLNNFVTDSSPKAVDFQVEILYCNCSCSEFD